MNSFKILKNLYLVKQAIKNRIFNIVKDDNVNEVIIIDQSGSMGWTYSKLVDDVINYISGKSNKGTLSIGVFSSQGQFQWLIQGASLADKELIYNVLRQNRPYFNMTCFADILIDLKRVVQNLKAFSNRTNLIFFTDGQDNQGTTNVLSALDAIASDISLGMFVGYGDYYDRKRLSDMAQRLGAAFVHASNLSEVGRYFADFGENGLTAVPKINVPLEAQPLYGFVFTYGSNGVEVISDETGEVLVSPGTNDIYFFSNKKQGTLVEVDDETLYAASVALLQNDKTEEVLEVLSYLGDVNFVNKVLNSYTIREIGSVQQNLVDAVLGTGRFQSGKVVGCVPKADAFCVLDLMDILLANGEVTMLPKHPKFNYTKIGRTFETLEGYPKFEADRTVEVKLDQLVWSSEKLNLSVLIRLNGTIQLDSEANKYGFDTLFNTYQWKTYTIISDGKLNVSHLPLKNVNDSLMKVLEENNLIESNNGVVVIDLTRIPVINRAMAKQYSNLDLVAENLILQKRFEAANKVYNWLFEQLPEELQDKVDNLVSGTKFSEDQFNYLSKFGVQLDGSFNPPSKAQDPTDEYFITTIKFGLKSFSSWPKVEDVIKKLAEEKKLTASDQMIADAYNHFLDMTSSPVKYSGEEEILQAPILKNDTEKAVWLKSTLNDNRKELRELRRQINRVRMGVIVGKGSFDQLPKLEETNVHPYNGFTLTLNINRNVKVKI